MSDGVFIRYRRLHENAQPPRKAYTSDAGLDLSAAEAAHVAGQARQEIGTGIAVHLPAGYFGLIHHRSSTLARFGLQVRTAIIDAGFQGELKVIVHNPSYFDGVDVEPGDRLAQLLVLPVPAAKLVEVDEFPDSARGTSGFGSTGDGAEIITSEGGS